MIPTARGKLARLKDMANILQVEKVAEIQEEIIHDESKQVLSRRLDFSAIEIAQLDALELRRPYIEVPLRIIFKSIQL